MKRAHLAGIFLGLATLFAVCSVASAQDAPEDGTEQPEKKEEGPTTLKTIGALGLTIVGFGMIMIPAARTFSSSYSYEQARLMLVNLLRTNPYQAEMMAKKMKGTFCEAISAALKAGGMMQSQDWKIVNAATLPTYDATGQGIAAAWKGDVGKAKLGLMAAAGGAVIGLTGGSFPAIPVIIALCAVAAFLRLLWFLRELDSSLMRARAEIMPEVDSAVTSGRFRGPPP